MKRNQKGFSIIELVIVVGIVAAIGLIGYKIHNATSSKASNVAETSATSVAKESTTAVTIPQIDNKSDLDSASKSLDESDAAGDNQHDSALLDSHESELDD